MSKKLYLAKGNMFVLKTPRVFEEYTILAIGSDMYGNQLTRARKGNIQKSFQNNYSYDLNINDFAYDNNFEDFINKSNSKKMLIELNNVFGN